MRFSKQLSVVVGWIVAFSCSSPTPAHAPEHESERAPEQSAGSPASAALPPAHDDGVDREVRAAELESHVRFLASDELRGRDTGSPGGVEAARYLARELERAGVKPAGDDGTFLQLVPLESVRVRSIPELKVTTTSGEALATVYGIDFDQLSGERGSASLKVRVVNTDSDASVPPAADTALFLDGSSRERREWLERAGAPDALGWGLYVVPGADKEGASADTSPPRGRMRVAKDGPKSPPRLAVRGALRERFRRGEIAKVELALDAERETPPAYNVLGRIDGNAALGGEAIVFSAHYDHLGAKSASASGASSEDTIFNGADDDASGCAAVLEVAEALAERPPARTLVFLLATGEERGLLGTDYYLEHPVVPLARTVCNLNFEMIGRPDPMVGGAGKLWLTGFERSNLGPEFQRAGLALVPDPRPSENFFQRSDNYAFARRGIVAQTLSSYNMHTDYHHVSDEAGTLDYAHMEACVRASLAASRALADGAIAPSWLPGGAPASR